MCVGNKTSSVQNINTCPFVEKKINLSGVFLASLSCKAGLWLVSGYLDFERFPELVIRVVHCVLTVCINNVMMEEIWDFHASQAGGAFGRSPQ